jgi:octaprenyl-diphosphate synthase
MTPGVAPEHEPSSLAVQATIMDGLKSVVDIFDRQLESDLPAVRSLCKHIERYRGKMLRPSLVLACGLAAHPAWECDSPPASLGTLLRREHFVIAAVCEMVHMATLVHDDVLDEADIRRRGRTVNRLYGNEPAVILGDYLIAGAYHLCSQLQDQRAALAVAHASMVLCSGELLQLHHRKDFSLDVATYFEIIDRKTAVLIAASCELGAAQSGAPPAVCADCREIGRQLGIAFQIQDDILDLTGAESVVGKSVGKDLEKGKLTLPLVHHLSCVSPRDRTATLDLLARRASGDDPSAASRLVDALESTGSLVHAREQAFVLVSRAKELLRRLHRSDARTLLLEMADAVVARSA